MFINKPVLTTEIEIKINQALSSPISFIPLPMPPRFSEQDLIDFEMDIDKEDEIEYKKDGTFVVLLNDQIEKEDQEQKKIKKVKTRKVSFSKFVTIGETYSKYEYDRTPIEKERWTYGQIAKELNELKREMEVHPESIKYTKFYLEN